VKDESRFATRVDRRSIERNDAGLETEREEIFLKSQTTVRDSQTTVRDSQTTVRDSQTTVRDSQTTVFDSQTIVFERRRSRRARKRPFSRPDAPGARANDRLRAHSPLRC
jgi:hypothetical protein